MQLEIEVLENVEATMRDGVILRSDVYRPVAPGEYPTLLCRTPYDKCKASFQHVASVMASHGYICVLQDIRGTYASDGEFHLARNGRSSTTDAEDGYDSVEWAAGLPGSDGQVCVWGHSYSSWAAWVAAGSCPPHLKALFGSGMASSILNHTRGIFETGRRLHWMYQQAADQKRRAGFPEITAAEAHSRWYDVERFKWVWFLPLDEIPETAFGSLTPQLREYMRQQAVETWGFDEVHPDISVPTCSLTGWYDRILGAIEHYEGMEANGPEAVKGTHRMIVGPWGHGMTALCRNQGPLDFGPEADTLYADHLLDWCDQQLKGKAPKNTAPVRVFVMGQNQWQNEQEWPLARTQYTDFFLHSDGNANSARGQGRLSADTPGDLAPDGYVYDPRDPVMSMMGRNIQMEPRFQAPLDDRDDILVYRTAPLEQDLRVIGPVRVELWVSSDAPDTDFTAKLVDEDESGQAVNITYGILRCEYRDGYDVKAPHMTPENIYKIEITLNPTGNLFRAGHRIRLDISSSDFPNVDRNHNTGRDFWSDAELRPAKQTLFHDSSRPSRLVLPIIPD